jgi:hypothetical protein
VEKCLEKRGTILEPRGHSAVKKSGSTNLISIQNWSDWSTLTNRGDLSKNRLSSLQE